MKLWKYLGATLLIIFALVILFTSILKSASIRYSFSPFTETTTAALSPEKIIDYNLPSEGRILPDNPLWFLISFKDRIWLAITPNIEKKAELNLLFADERLVASNALFSKKEYNLGMAFLVKAEKYLEEASQLEERARKKGIDTTKFIGRITLAALKHREIIDGMLTFAPPEAKPEIIKVKNITCEVFVRERNAMQEKGETPPNSPSEWD